MGFYEEGMELQEMRQILDALNQSVTDGETQFLDDDMERAIRVRYSKINKYFFFFNLCPFIYCEFICRKVKWISCQLIMVDCGTQQC